MFTRIDPCPEPDESAHILAPYFNKVHFNIIFPYMLRSSKRSVVLRLFDQNFVCISDLSHVCYMAHPSHLPDIIILLMFGEKKKLHSFPQPHDVNNSGINVQGKFLSHVALFKAGSVAKI
jgi:hypothetical protein